jgi:ribosomal protein S21
MKVNASITVEPNESADSMWRRFRKATDKAGTIRALASKSEFTPKGERKALKSKHARKRKRDGAPS